jgi:hypothetical protein
MFGYSKVAMPPDRYGRQVHDDLHRVADALGKVSESVVRLRYDDAREAEGGLLQVAN